MNGPESADAALTRQVRAGDSRAVSELYERHHAAVLAFARRLCRDPHTAEDLASEAFARTLRTVRTGAAGPTGGWRPYLYAVARNTAAEWARSDQRLILTGEFREDELTAAGPEPPDDLVTRAYRSLPPRWQTVLWHTLIEDEEPERVAKILGITPGNVGVLAFRAREGLRKAYLAAHVTGAPECREYAEPLATVVRKKNGRLPRTLRAHLASCPGCTRAHTELLDLNATLRSALPIALFPLTWEAATWTTHGTAAAGAGKAAAAGAGKGGSAVVPGWTAPGWAVPVVAVTAVVAAVVGVGLSRAPGPAPTPAPQAVAPAASGVPSPAPSPPLTRKPAPTGRSTPTREPTRAKSPRPASPRTSVPRAVAGARLTYAGRCVAAAGGRVAALPCADPRTAWRTRGGPQRFQLVNVVSGRCLTAGERYDSVAFNGGGMLAVRLAPCSAAPAQRWHRPGFSDGVPRLVSVPSGKALSIGKEFAGKRPPTAFILYGPYTGSADQRITLSNSS